MNLNVSRKLSIAPMLDYTDRHERYFLRLLSKQILLYTEMVTSFALLHGDPTRFLRHSPEDNPCALQLGGSIPADLALCARMGEDAGYQEINLNCGCPSDRVQSGSFGACLMREAERVAECVAAMRAVVKIPVTVKTRIGIDHDDSWEFFQSFIKTVEKAGCEVFIVHARKAWLKGLSPRENREKPPLNYGFAYRIKKENPHLHISLNGGVRSLEAVSNLLNGISTRGITADQGGTVGEWDDCAPVALDGVMVGREAYENPWFLAQADSRIFGVPDQSPPDQKTLLEAYFPYMSQQLAEGCPLNIMTRHLMGMFAGIKGSRRYRQILSDHATRKGAGLEVLVDAISAVEC